jgi:hexosaminidase
MKFLLPAFLVPLLFSAPMPLPWKSVPAAGHLLIDSSFAIEIHGFADPRMDSAVRRFTARISRQTGIPIIGGKNVLTIQNVPGGADESYQLDISPGKALLGASTVEGALHGLETFAQLIEPGAQGFEVASVYIEDHPRFPWRGLMIDCSRHWMPVEVIERNLDAMAAVKLNVLHWHLSDDQGFRVESKRFPRLQQLGSDGHFYTQDQVKHIVAYARDRGIRVVPEFDIPGHTTSWFVGYPELASAPGPYAIERNWGVFQPTMDPSREETYKFLDKFLGEMAALFPDQYFHIGGDEVDPSQWKQSASIQAFARQRHFEMPGGLQAYFNHRVQQILKKYGKTMIGWDEILHPDLESDAVIQSWRGPAALADAAKKGHHGILSFGYYLDYLKPASFHYAIDPMVQDENSALILGGEACMWSEYVSAETIDSRIWPRTAAIAERLWSARDVTNLTSMYDRLDAISRVLESIGIRSNEQMMLDRMGSGSALRVLADASESLGIEGRRDARKYTSLVPLNRFVDAVPPESPVVRHLEGMAEKVASSPDVAKAEIAGLRAAFSEWSANDPQIAGNVLTLELIPLSKNLSNLGSIGLRALEFLSGGKSAPPDWALQQLQEIDAMEKPVAEVHLAAIRPVRILLSAIEIRHVRSGNKPARNGLATVVNWTSAGNGRSISVKSSPSRGLSE